MVATPPALRSRPSAALSPDLVVVGGGIAGVMAALAAKTDCNRVLLLEPSNVLGGQGTTGGVAGFCGDTARVNRPFADLVARLSRYHLIEPYRPNDDRRAYDLEWCAFFLQEMVIERGIDLLLHARVVAATAEEGVVRRLSVSTAGGLIELEPDFVVDASGACVVPVLTGFPVMHEGANRQLPMSLYFTLWDTGRPVQPILPEGCPRWWHDDEIPMTSLHRFPSGKVEVKMKVVGFDAADGFSRSAAEVFARRQMHALIHYLQTVGYRGRKLDQHVLASVSRSIGIREERRILGEHVLTEAEARRAVIFPDAVAVNTYHIDFHWPDRMQRAGTGITDMLDPHHLPLRMMIPRGARNLLVAGRGASGDQTAMSAFRVMAVVAQLGFAAGHAARQCLETATDLTTIDVTQLQATLAAEGQSINLSDYGEYLRCDHHAHETIVSGADAGPTPDRLWLQVTDNAGFIAGWTLADERPGWQAHRRERQWGTPEPSVRAELSTPGADGVVRMDDGACVEATADSGHVVCRLSRDAGCTWTVHPLAGTEARPTVRPAIATTRTGLAVVYVGRSGSLQFWHGSIERIVDGAPASAPQRLDQPPEHVEAPHYLRA
ncbi:MAG: FAD-dependent oxidoreductase [Opitutaceae bacterium]|nr:FAD-dependent oxidoreductase [Opitutaceae bacterium]